MDRNYMKMAIRDQALLDRAKAIGAKVKTWQGIEDWLLPKGVIFSNTKADGYLWQFRFCNPEYPSKHVSGFASSNEMAHLFLLQKVVYALHEHLFQKSELD